MGIPERRVTFSTWRFRTLVSSMCLSLPMALVFSTFRLAEVRWIKKVHLCLNHIPQSDIYYFSFTLHDLELSHVPTQMQDEPGNSP